MRWSDVASGGIDADYGRKGNGQATLIETGERVPVFIKRQGARHKPVAEMLKREQKLWDLNEQLGRPVRMPAFEGHEVNGHELVVWEFIEGSRPEKKPDVPVEEIQGILFFDHLTYQSDRHSGNLILGNDGHLWCIDNEDFAFWTDRRRHLRTWLHSDVSFDRDVAEEWLCYLAHNACQEDNKLNAADLLNHGCRCGAGW